MDEYQVDSEYRVENVDSTTMQTVPWKAIGLEHGLHLRELASAPTGALTAIIDVPAGYRSGAVYCRAPHELFMLSGDIRLGDSLLESGAYSFYPAGVNQGEWRSERGCSMFVAFHSRPMFEKSTKDAANAARDLLVPHLDTWNMEWEDPLTASKPSVPFRPGVFTKMLRTDPTTGATTHLAGLIAGWFMEGMEVHPVREENFTLSGDVHIGEIAGEKGYTMTAGSYFTRPAGIAHGPIISKNGNVNLVRTTEGPLGIDYRDNPRALDMIQSHLHQYPWG